MGLLRKFEWLYRDPSIAREEDTIPDIKRQRNLADLPDMRPKTEDVPTQRLTLEQIQYLGEVGRTDSY